MFYYIILLGYLFIETSAFMIFNSSMMMYIPNQNQQFVHQRQRKGSILDSNKSHNDEILYFARSLKF